jgi:hypothetical protein
MDALRHALPSARDREDRPALAFVVDNLDTALQGKQILIPPNSPSPGVRVAFILDDGAPIELLEFAPDSD